MVAAENRKRLPAKTSGTTATVALLETRLKWRAWSVWSVRVSSSRLVSIWCKDHDRAKLTIAHVVAWLLHQVEGTLSHLLYMCQLIMFAYVCICLLYCMYLASFVWLFQLERQTVRRLLVASKVEGLMLECHKSLGLK